MPSDRNAPSFRPSPKLYPYQPRWFDSSVGRVHYVDEGEGRPILMLHGNPTWSFLYRGIISKLRGDYRCIAVDYPGFGLSDRPGGYGYTPGEHARVVTSLVRELDLSDVVVLGQDWGGPIGVWTACAEPGRVSGLAFGNTWCWPTRRLINFTFGWVLSRSVMQKAIIERNLFVEKIMPVGVARPLAEEVMDHYRGAQPVPELRKGVAEFPRQLLAARSWLAEIDEKVPDLLAQVPLLLVWGMQDFAFAPGAFIPGWQERFHDHVVVELPHAKHFFQEDAPAEVVMAIRSRFPV